MGRPDYLVIDMPPGTGDVAISVSQLLPGASFLLVTTPHDTAQLVARLAGRMAAKVGLRISGVVENMASFLCDGCGREHALFGAGAGEQLAETLDVPLLARIPLDPAVPRPAVLADPDAALAQRFVDLAARVAGQPSRVRRSLPLLT